MSTPTFVHSDVWDSCVCPRTIIVYISLKLFRILFTPMMINKVTPFIEFNYWWKNFETACFNDWPNQDLIKVQYPPPP